MQKQSNTTPSAIVYHSGSKVLELTFVDGENAELTAEVLRVFSPSAEVRGHSEDQRVLQTGKKYIDINSIEPVGNYAIRIVFSDGHDTGIYSWDYLRELHDEHDQMWQQYLRQLEGANASRLPAIPVGQWVPDK